jgi:hypothetical protein
MGAVLILKIAQCGQYRIGRCLAQTAEGGALHGVADLGDVGVLLSLDGI